VLRIAGLRLLHHYSHSSDLADLAAPPLVKIQEGGAQSYDTVDTCLLSYIIHILLRLSSVSFQENVVRILCIIVNCETQARMAGLGAGYF
jgi:hypothetical protein